MASSSQNLMSHIDPLTFMRPTFNDYWLSDLYARDTETLTRALQKSLEPALITPILTPTVSGLSGSDPETPTPAASTPKRHRNGVAGAKATKRKSRASKRSQTTFITADAANFRHMVQQVTGVKIGGGGGGGSFSAAEFSVPIVKPEPMKGFGSVGVGGRFTLGGAACPPTLDTSALLLDQSRTAVVSPAAEMVPPFVPVEGFEFDVLQSFPTLDSWK